MVMFRTCIPVCGSTSYESDDEQSKTDQEYDSLPSPMYLLEVSGKALSKVHVLVRHIVIHLVAVCKLHDMDVS